MAWGKIDVAGPSPCRPSRYRTPAGIGADGRSRNGRTRGLGLRRRRLGFSRLRRATARTRHAGCRQAANVDQQADQHELFLPHRGTGRWVLARPIRAIGSLLITTNSDSIPHKADIVSFHFGLPEPALLARVKAAGC